MSYAIAWNPEPTRVIDGVLAVASAEACDRIEAALVSLHEALRISPESVGESRRESTDRVVIADPLIVRFSVDPARRLVRVYAVSVFDNLV